jgi:hypothetical protein
VSSPQRTQDATTSSFRSSAFFAASAFFIYPASSLDSPHVSGAWDKCSTCPGACQAISRPFAPFRGHFLQTPIPLARGRRLI